MNDSSPIVENLAALRALALRLVGAAEADDLLQDTALMAEGGGAAPRTPAAFWKGVLRNLAGKRRRAAARRAHHERRAAEARAPSQRTPLDAAAQSELLQRLTAELRALPEPYRAALLQRYFAARTPTEIANARGVPLATVKSQLQRGLAMLRQRLDVERGGDWRHGLVVALGLEPSRRTAAATTLHRLVAALWLLALPVALLWRPWFSNDGAPPPPAKANTAETQPGRSPEPHDAPGTRTLANTSSDANAVEPQRAWTAQYVVSGRCLDEAGRPRDGLPVHLAHHALDRYSRPTATTVRWAEATTDEDGRFELACAGTPLPCRLEIDLGSAFALAVPVRLQQPLGHLPLGDLTVPQLVPLRGRVIDRLRRPRPGATITLTTDGDLVGRLSHAILPDARCDDAGAFEVQIVPGTYHVNLPDELPIERENDQVVVPAEGLELELRVEAHEQLATASGVVVDGDGRPIADAEVTAIDRAGNPAIATTDAEGRFVVRNAFHMEVGPLTFAVRHDAFDDARFDAHASWRTDGLRLVLQPRIRCAVEVTAVDTGAPVEEFRLLSRRLVSDREPDDRELVVRSAGYHAGGRLVLDAMRSGRHELLVVPSDTRRYGIAIASLQVSQDGAEPTLRVALPVLARRKVQVRTASGAAVTGCHLELSTGRSPGPAQTLAEYGLAGRRDTALSLCRVVTDEHGDAILVGPATGDLRVHALGPNCVQQSAPIDLREAAPLRLVVVPFGTLRVRAEPAALLERFEGGLRIGVGAPDARPRAPSTSSTQPLDADGRARFARLPADRTVDVHLRWHTDALVRSLELPADATTDVVVDLRRFLPGTVHGAIDVSGLRRAARTAMVSIQGEDGVWVRTHLRVEVDATGAFELSALPGRYQLWLLDDEHEAFEVQPAFEVLRDTTTDVRFTLDR